MISMQKKTKKLTIQYLSAEMPLLTFRDTSSLYFLAVTNVETQ